MALHPPYFHVGIVVPEIEAAQAHLTEVLGVSWGRIVDLPLTQVRDADGNDAIDPMRLCYSREQPFIELVEERPGTMWVRNEHSNLHHLGVWADDFAADSAMLEDLRCPLQRAGRRDDVAPSDWVYHRDPLGFLLELVDHTNAASVHLLQFGDDSG